MRLTVRLWFVSILLAIIGFGLWYQFGYPQFKFIDLGVDKNEAFAIAQSYLRKKGVDDSAYFNAVVFESDDWADRYLQKTIGLKAEEEFIRNQDFELFSWKIRFFKELHKEEYVIGVSPKSGEIIDFVHLIEDVESRDDIGKEAARISAEEFLTDKFGLDLSDYEFHEEKIKRYESRIDYAFSWEKKEVYIPWQKDQGGAKLLIGCTLSGKEIREFSKGRLDIPEKFMRYINNQMTFGVYLSSFSLLVIIFLVTSSIFIVLKKRHSSTMRICRKWFFYLCAFFVVINIVYIFNNFQSIIMSYATSSRLSTHVGIYLVNLSINLIFLSFVFILPGLAGEALHAEIMPENKHTSFLYYIKSSFYTRQVSKLIILGYLLFFVLLGLQTTIFYFGQRYLGVWKEWIKLTQFSSAYLPFLSAFVIGASAGLNEEILFRLFGIHWGRKHLKNTFLAVALASFLWGFGHTSYPIFPVWFRGIEVSLLGLLIGFAFLRYGLITVIIAHYLLDVFWGTAAYILGKGPAYLFYGSILMLVLPLGFAAVCYFVNKKEEEKDAGAQLVSNQTYNLEILTTFVSAKKTQGVSRDTIKQELIDHEWDIVLVDLAIRKVFKE